MAKNDTIDERRVTIYKAHASNAGPSPSILKHRRNVGYVTSATFQRVLWSLRRDIRCVRFATKIAAENFRDTHKSIHVTYKSGANGHYIVNAITMSRPSHTPTL